MSQWPLIGTALIGLAGVALYCVRHDGHQIEQDVTERATRALAGAGVAVAGGGLHVDGRDVTLTGERGSAIVSEASRSAVGGVWGVRDPVHVIITEPPPAVTPPPPAVPVAVQKLETELTNFLDGKNIQFAFNSDVILPAGQLILNEVFRILTTAPTVAVDVSGHTDTDGNAAYNIDLSQRRAAAVRKYLVARGIPAERITSAGFGGGKPVFPNDTPENKARNRRIEFHAVGLGLKAN